MIQAKLVKEDGQEFLQPPNGYRQKVLGRSTGPGGKVRLQVASKSCTSFVLDTLNAMNLSTLPRLQPTVSARGLARSLLSSAARGLRPDGVVYYSVDADRAKDIPTAMEKVLNTKGE